MAKMSAPTVVGIDPVSGILIGLWAVGIIATGKLIAYKYHGHPLAQAFLLVV